MIVTATTAPGADGRATLRMVTQSDHAALAADILRLWRADGLPTSPRRADLLDATREHDNGWREVDAAPMTREDGRPHDFRSMPAAARIELWRRGIERHAAERPGAAALIAQHALALHRGRQNPEWDDALAAWRGRRDELMAAGDWSLEALEHEYRFLDLADTVSLAACAGWSQRVEHRGVTLEPRLGARSSTDGAAEGSAVTLALDPFPLAGATSFKVDARSIEDRRYAGDADLAVTLASARRWRLHVRLIDLRESLSLS